MSSIAATDYDLKNNVWGNFNYYTYILLNKNIGQSSGNLQKLIGRIHQIYKAHIKEVKIDFHLQPLTSIHLHSDLQIDLPGNGSIQYVNIFFVVALFILAV